MTDTPLSDDVVKITTRLRRKVRSFPAQGGGMISTDSRGKTTSSSYVTDYGYRLANPDGPTAATMIESIAARAALEAARYGEMVEALVEAARCLADAEIEFGCKWSGLKRIHALLSSIGASKP